MKGFHCRALSNAEWSAVNGRLKIAIRAKGMGCVCQDNRRRVLHLPSDIQETKHPRAKDVMICIDHHDVHKKETNTKKRQQFQGVKKVTSDDPDAKDWRSTLLKYNVETGGFMQ